jgi:hypothetical protein
MSAEIIDFRTAHRAPVAVATVVRTRSQRALTTTAKNLRLRQKRFEVWRRADAAMDYWHARLKLADAARRAAREGMPEACSHPEVNQEARGAILKSYREALREQLLTPAPDLASVNWKRANSKDLWVIDLKKERLDQVIADDLAFLAAHPTRKARKVEQA